MALHKYFYTFVQMFNTNIHTGHSYSVVFSTTTIATITTR